MIKRLSLLNGVSIIAVVMNHAVGWTMTGMFWWTNQYRIVTIPDFEQLGSPTYYVLVAIEQLALFSVPAFLFVAGFFSAYAARTERGGLSWSFVRTRILKLLWPYLIWSLVYFAFEAAQGMMASPPDYLRRLLTGGASPAYFFVPLLIQFYLCAPLIWRWAKERAWLLLAVATTIQIASTALFTTRLTGIDIPSELQGTTWLFIWYALYYPLGMIIGFRSGAVQDYLARWKWALVVFTLILGVVSILESEWLFGFTKSFSWAQNPIKYSSEAYAVVFILAFLAFEGNRGRGWSVLNRIGGRSYGIYLVHLLLMELIARLIRRLTPALLAQPLLFFVILVVSSIGGVVLLMEVVARTRARSFYRYLFG